MFRALLLAIPLLAIGAAAPAQAEQACATPAHHAFDFWVGRWDVFDTHSGDIAGHSLIERLYQGCAIRENWSEDGFSGGSLNHYSTKDGEWRQVWTDSSGAWREFVGGVVDASMVLIWRQPEPKVVGGAIQVRMSFTPSRDGSVRQYSDTSADGGRTWKPRYDYTYRRAREGM